MCLTIDRQTLNLDILYINLDALDIVVLVVVGVVLEVVLLRLLSVVPPVIEVSQVMNVDEATLSTIVDSIDIVISSGYGHGYRTNEAYDEGTIAALDLELLTAVVDGLESNASVNVLRCYIEQLLSHVIIHVLYALTGRIIVNLGNLILLSSLDIDSKESHTISTGLHGVSLLVECLGE